MVDIFQHGPFNSTSSIKNPSIILGGKGIRLFAIDDLRLYQSALTANDAKMLLPTTSYIGSGIVPIGDTFNRNDGFGDGKSSAKLKLPVVPATQPNTPPANPSGIIYQRPNFSVTYPSTHDPANIPFDNNGILARYLLDFFVTVQQIKYYFPYYATKYPDYIENFKNLMITRL